MNLSNSISKTDKFLVLEKRGRDDFWDLSLCKDLADGLFDAPTWQGGGRRVDGDRKLRPSLCFFVSQLIKEFIVRVSELQLSGESTDFAAEKTTPSF